MAESGTPTPESIALGERLRQLRTRRKLSLESVSELLTELGQPMAPTVLSRTERGKRDLRAAEVAVLARAYGVTSDEILSALAPDWHVARAQERMTQAWTETHNAIYTFVEALSQRWAANPETLASPREGVPPVVVVTDPDQHAAMRRVLEQLGVAGAVTLVLGQYQPDEEDDDG